MRPASAESRRRSASTSPPSRARASRPSNADVVPPDGLRGAGVKIGIVDAGFGQYGLRQVAGELPSGSALKTLNYCHRLRAARARHRCRRDRPRARARRRAAPDLHRGRRRHGGGDRLRDRERHPDRQPVRRLPQHVPGRRQRRPGHAGRHRRPRASGRDPLGRLGRATPRSTTGRDRSSMPTTTGSASSRPATRATTSRPRPASRSAPTSSGTPGRRRRSTTTSMLHDAGGDILGGSFSAADRHASSRSRGSASRRAPRARTRSRSAARPVARRSGSTSSCVASARGTLQHQVAAGSLIEPASGPQALAVGAVCWESGALASYSSQGPMIGGGTKPDLAGFDSVSSVTYGGVLDLREVRLRRAPPRPSPHVAGAAALLKQQHPGFGPAELQAALEAAAADLGAAGKDNAYGAGRLRLPVRPTPTTSFPSSVGRRTAVLAGTVKPHRWEGRRVLRVLDRPQLRRVSPRRRRCRSAPRPASCRCRVQVDGLEPTTTYHARLVVENEHGVRRGDAGRLHDDVRVGADAQHDRRRRIAARPA